MDLNQKGFSMAEYIWIDGMNGVRSKTKVRVLLLTPTYSLNARFQLFLVRAKATEALLSGNKAWHGERFCLSMGPQQVLNSRKCLILLLILFFPTDSRQALQGRQGALRMELRRFILRSSSRRQLRCLPPPRSHLPRSVPSWRQHPRIM